MRGIWRRREGEKNADRNERRYETFREKEHASATNRQINAASKGVHGIQEQMKQRNSVEEL